MFVFEQKGSKEVLRASPRSCMSRARGSFRCGFSWGSATPGAHLESAACHLQLLGTSCVSCLVHGIWLVGSEGSLRVGLPWEVPRLAPCWVPVASFGEESSCIWGTFWIRQSISPAHQILPQDLCVFPSWEQGDYAAVSAGPRAKFWVPWPIIKW